RVHHDAEAGADDQMERCRASFRKGAVDRQRHVRAGGHGKKKIRGGEGKKRRQRGQEIHRTGLESRRREPTLTRLSPNCKSARMSARQARSMNALNLSA